MYYFIMNSQDNGQGTIIDLIIIFLIVAVIAIIAAIAFGLLFRIAGFDLHIPGVDFIYNLIFKK